MNDFTPTHRIIVTRPGCGTVITEVCLVDGAAYTKAEWEDGERASWKRHDDGTWTIDGYSSPAPGASVRVETVNS